MGRELRLREGDEPYLVIGVAQGYKVDATSESPKAYVHLPLAREATSGNYVARTPVSAGRMMPALRRALLALDPELVFLDRGTMRDLADVRLFPVRGGRGSSGRSGSWRSWSRRSGCMA